MSKRLSRTIDYYVWLMSDWAYLGGVRFVQMTARALSEQQRCVRGQHRSPNLKLRLGHKSVPLGQCGRASVLVNVTGDEMALLIEMVVDLGVN